MTLVVFSFVIMVFIVFIVVLVIAWWCIFDSCVCKFVL